MRSAAAAALCLLALLGGATAQNLLLDEVRSALSAVASAASAATAAATESLRDRVATSALRDSAEAGISGARDAAAAWRAERLASISQAADSTAALVDAARGARRAALSAGLGALEAQAAGVGTAMRSLVDAHIARLRNLGAGLGTGLVAGGASWDLGDRLADRVAGPVGGALGNAGMTLHLPLSGGLTAWGEKARAFDDCVIQLHASLALSHGLFLGPAERRDLLVSWDNGLYACRQGLGLR